MGSCLQKSGAPPDDHKKKSSQYDSIANIDFDEIKKRGYITAIVENISTGLFIYKGRPMGYEYELLTRFAKRHNLELRLDVTKSVDEAFRKLNDGSVDIIAYNLTITKERKEKMLFTDPHSMVRLVLVQRKPDNWRKMKVHEIEESLIRNPVDLIGREVYVRKSTSHVQRLENLSEEIGGDILIIEDFPEVQTEGLIKKVADQEIDFTVAEEDIALVNATYFPILDVKTPVSFPQQIAWGLRLASPDLRDSLNEWLSDIKSTADYYVIYNRYFKNKRASLLRMKSDYSSIASDKISPYDDLIKNAADVIGWDWKLLAAQIFQESRFDPYAKSWAGAIGLMQLLPTTANQYGIRDLTNPAMSIRAGMKHIVWLDKVWDDFIWDDDERIKFILASYNIGQGHVMDAYNLAKKYGEDQNDWEVVSEFLLKKSQPEYYNDPVVEFGYCRGTEPVYYVSKIMDLYQTYTDLYEEPEMDSTLMETDQPPI